MIKRLFNINFNSLHERKILEKEERKKIFGLDWNKIICNTLDEDLVELFTSIRSQELFHLIKHRQTLSNMVKHRQIILRSFISRYRDKK